ncbi:MAG: hypothetical protein BEN18_02935 [Epulopiscium sp. Nuni2H_MBin001]|nr:MAG: hypothetical protein BEN18_02935 [Epulopiscium sp. Nuni2H_MBin001]
MDNQLVSEQALLFFECLRIGVLMGVIYDVLRIFRKVIKHFDIMVHIEDLLYWVTCSCIAFSILYMHNYANIRIFAFFGIVLGASFYFLTFSVFLMSISDQLIAWGKAVIRMLLIPIKWTISLLLIPLGIINDLLIKYNIVRRDHVRYLKRQLVLKHADVRTEINIAKKSFSQKK